MTNDGGELSAQQRRTRRAIVDAAARLMDEDRWPSVSDVAVEAEVSRRTVYLYFSTLEQLLTDAALGRISATTVETELEPLDDLADPVERVARAVAAIQRSALHTERFGRAILRLGTPPTARQDGVAPRGYRRIAWLERALEPAHSRLSEAAWTELVSQLTMITGWEAAIALRDIRGMGTEKVIATSAQAARRLVTAALTEAQLNPDAS